MSQGKRAAKLTWNQQRALRNLTWMGQSGGTSQNISETPHMRPYLCGSAARAALDALVKKGLAERLFTIGAKRYRATAEGFAMIASLSHGEG